MNERWSWVRTSAQLKYAAAPAGKGRGGDVSPKRMGAIKKQLRAFRDDTAASSFAFPKGLAAGERSYIHSVRVSRDTRQRATHERERERVSEREREREREP